jgi:hypothetical protein
MLAIVAALVIGGLLAAQLAAGDDPALAPKAAARAKSQGTTSTSQSATSDNSYGYYGSSGSDGSSGSGAYSSQQPATSSPAPVTSSTS